MRSFDASKEYTGTVESMRPAMGGKFSGRPVYCGQMMRIRARGIGELHHQVSLEPPTTVCQLALKNVHLLAPGRYETCRARYPVVASES